MVFRFILRYLSNNEHLIQKLSESKPVRRAAQIFVSYYYRGQSIVEESGVRKSITPEKFRDFARRLGNNFKEELENAKKQIKKK